MIFSELMDGLIEKAIKEAYCFFGCIGEISIFKEKCIAIIDKKKDEIQILENKIKSGELDINKIERSNSSPLFLLTTTLTEALW